MYVLSKPNIIHIIWFKRVAMSNKTNPFDRYIKASERHQAKYASLTNTPASLSNVEQFNEIVKRANVQMGYSEAPELGLSPTHEKNHVGDFTLGATQASTLVPNVGLSLADKTLQGANLVGQLLSGTSIGELDTQSNRNMVRNFLSEHGLDFNHANDVAEELKSEQYHADMQAMHDDVSNQSGLVNKLLTAGEHTLNSGSIGSSLAGNAVTSLLSVGGGTKLFGKGFEPVLMGVNTASEIENATNDNLDLSGTVKATGVALTQRVMNAMGSKAGLITDDTIGNGITGASTLKAGLSMPFNTLEEAIPAMAESASVSSEVTGKVDVDDMAITGAMEGIAGAGMTAPALALNTFKDTTELSKQGANAVKTALSSTHEQMVNPEHKRYNPHQAHVNALTEFNNAQDEEIKAKATERMKEVQDVLTNQMLELQVKIDNTTDKEALNQLYTQRETITEQVRAINNTNVAVGAMGEERTDYIESVIANLTNPVQEVNVPSADESTTETAPVKVNPIQQVQSQTQSVKPHGFTDQAVRSKEDINHKFRIPFHNLNGRSLFSGGVVKADTLGFMQLLDQDDTVFKHSVGFTSITGGRHTKLNGKSHRHGYKIDLDLKSGDDVETYARVGQHIADLAKQHGYIIQVNAEKAGWGKYGKRGDVNFINGGGSHLDITVIGRVGAGQGKVINPVATQPTDTTTTNFSINGKQSSKSNLMLGTYSAFRKAGFTDGQARYLIGEVNRENEFNPKYLFGTHGDAGNAQTNLGFISWQGTRKTKLVKYLNSQGIKATQNNIPQTQEALDVMAQFLMSEIKQGDITFKKYKGSNYATPNFLSEANPDRNDHKWGHAIIGWAYGQSVLKSGKKFDSKAHEAKLYAGTNRINELLGSNIASSTSNDEQTMTPTTQDNLATQALNLIQELDDIDDDNENSARVEELQTQLNELQAQLANTTNESVSEVPEQSTGNLDTQIAEEVRKKELNRITSTLASVEVDDEAYYSKALTQINQLQESGVLTEQEANGFRQLLDVKIAIKGATANDVNSQILTGKRGKNDLETNLGVKDYQEIFTLARSNGQVPVKMLDYLTRFRDDHVSKANAIMEAVAVHDGVNPVMIAYSNKSNSWEITEEDLPANARKYEVRTNYIAPNLQQIINEAKLLSEFTNAWENIFAQQDNSKSTPIATSSVPVSNTAPTATPKTKTKIETPAQSVDNNSPFKKTHSPDKMNDPNGVWISRAKNKSMSHLNNKDNQVTESYVGMFGNPYMAKDPNSSWYVPDEQTGINQYRSLLAKQYIKHDFFKDAFENLRGRNLHSVNGANSIESKVISELLNTTAQMSDEDKLAYMRELATPQKNEASKRQALQKLGKEYNPKYATNTQQSSEQQVQEQQSQTQQSEEVAEQPEPVQVGEYLYDGQELPISLYNEVNDEEADIQAYHEYVANEKTTTATQVEETKEVAEQSEDTTTKPTTKETKSKKYKPAQQAILNDGINIVPEKLKSGDEIKQGKQLMVNIIHQIEFDDDSRAIVGGILKKYPNLSISFDGSNADIKAKGTDTPRAITIAITKYATSQLIELVQNTDDFNDDVLDKDIKQLKDNLDAIQNQLKYHAHQKETSKKDKLMIETLLESYESTVINGIQAKSLLTRIESQGKVKSNLFTTLINGIKAFFNIPNKTSVENLYERLLDTAAKTIEIQAKDSYKDGKLSVLASNKEERNTEADKSIYEQNVLKAGIVQSGQENIVQVKDLASRIRMYGLNELTRLGLSKPNERQQAQLEHFLAFQSQFTEALEMAFRKKGEKYRFEDHKQFLNTGTETNPKFDENLVTAISHAVYDMVVSNGTAEQLTKRELRKLLSADSDAIIPNHIAKKYRYIGKSLNEVTASLGSTVIRDLGLKQTDNVPAETIARLEASIGDWIIASLQIADMIHINHVSSKEFNEDRALVNGVSTKDYGEVSENAITSFVKITTNKTNNEIAEISKSTGSYLSDVLGVQSGKRLPSLKPSQETVKTIKNTRANISTKQANLILKAQQEPMKINTEFHGLVNKLREQDETYLYDLFGARVPEDSELTDKHVSKHESIKESAVGKKRELDSYFDFVGTLPNVETAFYDTIDVKVNSRMHYNSNTVNFQSSLIHRSLVEYENFKHEIDLSNWDMQSWFDEKGKPTDITLFLRAVFENAEGTKELFEEQLKELGMSDYTVDKVPSEIFMPIAMDYLLYNEELKSGVDAIRKLANNEPLDDNDKRDIKRIVDTWDMGSQSLRALMEVSNFLIALEDKEKFTTSLGISSDGVNNGTAIGMVLMGVFQQPVLNRLGIFDGKFKNYYDTRYDSQVADYYSAFEEYLRHSIDDVVESLGNDEDMQDKVVQLNVIQKLNKNLFKRKMLKAILIPFGYGAGTPRLIQSAFDQFEKDIYAQMEEIAKLKDDKPSEFEARGLALQKDLQVLLGDRFTLPKELLEFTFSDYHRNQLQRVYSDLLGKSIQNAIKSYASVFSDRRTFNIALHESTYTAYEMLKAKLEAEAEQKRIEYVKAKYPDVNGKPLARLLAYETLTPAQRKEWITDELDEVFPTIKTNYETDELNGSIELVEEKKSFLTDASVETATYQYDDNKKSLVKRYKNPLIRIKNILSAGVRPNSQMIQSVDSGNSAEAMTAGGVISINIHDANIGGNQHYNTMVQAQNKAFFEITAKYHMYLNSFSTFVSTISGLDRFTQEEQQALVAEWIGNFHKTEMLSSEMLNIIDSGQSLDVQVADLIDVLSEQVLVLEKSKITLLSKQKHIHQYAGEGGEYTLTDADYKMLEEQLKLIEKEVASLKTNAHIAVMHYQGKLGAVKGVHYNKAPKKLIEKFHFDATDVTIDRLKEDPELHRSIYHNLINQKRALVDYASKKMDSTKEVAEWVLRNPPNPVKEVINDKQYKPTELTNYSGGAYGADSMWDNIGHDYGVHHHVHYRAKDNTKLANGITGKATVLTNEELNFARSRVNDLLGLNLTNSVTGNLKARNYYQVSNADGVFAIAKLKNMYSVSGGTNVAVQLGIAMGKPVYVWNTETQAWYKFNHDSLRFEETDTPKLTQKFAGVGTRDVQFYGYNESTYLGKEIQRLADEAIRAVYANTFNTQNNNAQYSKNNTVAIQVNDVVTHHVPSTLIDKNHRAGQVAHDLININSSIASQSHRNYLQNLLSEMIKFNPDIKVRVAKIDSEFVVPETGKSFGNTAGKTVGSQIYINLNAPSPDLDLLEVITHKYIHASTNEVVHNGEHLLLELQEHIKQATQGLTNPPRFLAYMLNEYPNKDVGIREMFTIGLTNEPVMAILQKIDYNGMSVYDTLNQYFIQAVNAQAQERHNATLRQQSRSNERSGTDDGRREFAVSSSASTEVERPELHQKNGTSGKREPKQSISTSNQQITKLSELVNTLSVSNEPVKALYESLQGALGKDMDIVFTNEVGFKGKYHKGTLSINTSEWDKLTDLDKLRLLNHELSHALTVNGLTNKNTQAVKDLTNMYRYLKSVYETSDTLLSDEDKAIFDEVFNPTELDGITPRKDQEKIGIAEMVAYGLSNATMVAFIANNLNLKEAGVKAPTKTGVLDRFYQAIQSLLGIKKSYKAFLANVNSVIELSKSVASDTDTAYYSKVNQMPVQNVFKTLNTDVSTEHNARLDSLIDVFIGALYGSTNNKSLVNLSQGKLKNTSLINGLKSSDKEAYVTEAMAEVFKTLLNNHSGTLAYNGLNKLYQQAQKQFATAKDLFPEYETSSKDEQARLRAIHQFAFNPKGNKDSLAWFMALAVSNETLANQLSQVTVKKERDTATWFDKVMGALENVISHFNNVFFKSKDNTAKSKIDAYVQALAKIETKARNQQVDYLQSTYGYVHGKLRQGIDRPLKRALLGTLASKQLIQSKYKPIATIGKIASVYLDEDDLINKSNRDDANATDKLFTDIHNSLGKVRYKLVVDTINEVIGYGKRGLNIDKMVRVTQSIAQYRQMVKDNTRKAINKLFSTKLDKKTKSQITEVILQNDLASLLNHGFKPKDVLSMLDETKRREVIKEYENRLLATFDEERANDMLHQIYALAKYMATGDTNANLIKSAEGIAIGLGSNYETSFNQMNKDTFAVVDVLSSLIALEFTYKKSIQAVQQLDEKALTGLLNLHQEVIKKGKADFATNPYNYQKGYLPQITNPYNKLAYVKEEDVAKYQAKGFELVSELVMDDADGTDTRYMMLHTDYQVGNYVSGALDMVDTHHRGTTIYEQGIHDKEINKVVNQHLAIRKAKAKHRPTLKEYEKSGNALVPTYDTTGAIMDYHYEMSHGVRDSLLERNTQFDELLSTLNGSLEFKPEMFEHQKNIAKALYEDAKANFAKHPKEYIELDFNSTDPEIQRVVRMLPYSFRAETKRLYGNKVKTYPVHKSMFTASFGYQAYSVVNIWDKLDRNARLTVAEKLLKGAFDFWFKENGRKRALQAEKAIQELMTLVKGIIVIRSGGVLIGNILSNTYLLMTQGINPIRIIKDSTFAWRNVKQYRNQANRIEEINAMLLTTKSNQEKSKLNREKSQLEQSLNRNPLKEYMDAGLMSTIVEDLVGNEDTGYKSELQKKVDSYVDLIPKPIQKGLNEVTMGQGSKLHNLLSEATQFSDFSAKYTLAKFMQENNLSKEKSIYEAQLSFINYDIPTNQFLDYMNRLGLMVFTKFFLRFQRALTRMAINAPISSVMGHYAVEYAGGQGLYDPFILNRLGNPLDGSLLLLPDAVGSILTNPF